jgi:hypothetical protein
VPKLVWRVKLVAELEPGVATETEVARIERGEEVGLAELGLRLEEAKRLTAALQAEIVTAQVATAGERPRPCAACGQMLVSKGHYRATFRSLFGDVPVRVRRLLACPCQGPSEPRSFAAVDLGGGVAPELAYLTARYAALAPFGKVAALLSELLPIGGAANAGTVRNRTRAPSSCWRWAGRTDRPRTVLEQSSGRGSNPADVGPHPERTRPRGAVLAGGDVVAAEMEEQLCNSVRLRRLL